MRVIELQGVKNVRDLGGTPVADGRVVVPGLLYRGSALADATPDDCTVLFDTLGIHCVIDIRTGWEREAKPDQCPAHVENLHIPFYDKEKVGIEYTEPAKGTRLVGRDVACDPSLFYQSLANPLTAKQMRTCVHTIFTHVMDGQPVYEHCSGGKDRAGIMAVLLLTILGASREDILKDYLYTNVSRDADYEAMLQRFLRLTDGDKARARELVVSHRALPENLDIYYAAVKNNYGSMDDFIRNQLDVSDELREELRACCTQPA